jgi:hypothetical protein
MRRDAKYLSPSAPYASGLDRRARRGARGGPADHARLVRRRGVQGASGRGHWKTWCVGKARGWALTPRRVAWRGRGRRTATQRAAAWRPDALELGLVAAGLFSYGLALFKLSFLQIFE